MALTPINVVKKGKSGGGSVGSVIGGILGLAAAPFTAGASLPLAAAIPAAAGMMATGSTLGGIAGNAAAPGKGAESAMARRMDSAKPPEIEPSKVLEESLSALAETSPEIQKAYGDPLMKAYEMSMKRARGGMA
jgi:hypothetical protein